MTESFHIIHGTANGGVGEPIPVTFYLSSEVLDDEVSADYLAEVLKPDLVLAIEQHRIRRRTDKREKS